MTKIICCNIAAVSPAVYDRLLAKASPDRKARAEKYLRESDRRRCILAGALLRYAFQEEYPDREPVLQQNPYGKPLMSNAPEFHFNLSHSGDWVVIAWADRPVGVDVEKICWDVKKEAVARRFFTPGEQAWIFSKESSVASRFCQVWTAKESYLKYLGTGLTVPMKSFDVLTMENPCYFTEILEEAYCLAVCSRDPEPEIRFLAPDQLMQ